MWTHSFLCRDATELERALEKVSAAATPTLAMVFCSVQHDLDRIRALFTEHDIDLIGCTTAGEIVDDCLYEDSIAVLLLDLARDTYLVETLEHQVDNVYEKAYALGERAKKQFKNPALLILSGGLTVNAESIINGLQDGAGENLPIYGGLAGDDLELKETIAFSSKLASGNGLAMLAIDTDKVLLKGLAISGWKPVGGINTITKCEGNVIYEINGEPAYDVFIRYFGFSESQNKIDQLVTIQTNYPLQLLRKEGYSVLRSPMLVDKDSRSITLAAGVEEGEQFCFSNSPGFEVIEQTISEFSLLQKDFPEADALILFSCKGRHGAFGPMLEDEVKGIHEQWAKPMVGLLTYGEFGDSGKGSCEFHNETCSLVILKEK